MPVLTLILVPNPDPNLYLTSTVTTALMPSPGPTSNFALNPHPDLTPVQAQQFVLDNICFSPLPAARWPALALAPLAVPSSCPDLLLTFDDITMGELCVLTMLLILTTGVTLAHALTRSRLQLDPACG